MNFAILPGAKYVLKELHLLFPFDIGPMSLIDPLKASPISELFHRIFDFNFQIPFADESFRQLPLIEENVHIHIAKTVLLIIYCLKFSA